MPFEELSDLGHHVIRVDVFAVPELTVLESPLLFVERDLGARIHLFDDLPYP